MNKKVQPKHSYLRHTEVQNPLGALRWKVHLRHGFFQVSRTLPNIIKLYISLNIVYKFYLIIVCFYFFHYLLEFFS